MVVDEARALNGDLDRPRLITVMLGAVAHDLGKPSTTEVIDGRIRSLDHEQAGVAPATGLLDRLNVHSIDGFPVRDQVLGLVAHHLKPGMFFKAGNVSDGAFRRLAAKVDMELLAAGRTRRLPRAHGRLRLLRDGLVHRAGARAGRAGTPPDPILLGRHVLALGIAPGPRVGEILSAVYERQLDGEVTTLDQAIAVAEKLL
jgi:tRNA nucleotidyltransferase (CCA-adding enzyme)